MIWFVTQGVEGALEKEETLNKAEAPRFLRFLFPSKPCGAG